MITQAIRQAADEARNAALREDENDQVGALNAALDAAFALVLPPADVLAEVTKAIVDGMVDEDAAFEATMLLLGAGSFFRSHPLVLIFAMAQSMTEAKVDDFWRFCAGL